MRRLIQTTAALAAAVVTYTLVTLPPAAVTIVMPLPSNTVLGAYHIHTTRSDGAGSPDDVAAAAAKAGLRFAILTDHGDATRPPDAPRYAGSVLLIDAVEISAVEGHIVALGLNSAAPYRLGGEARDVIEDVHRLGGFAIVAHPDSARADLRWRPGGQNAGPGSFGAGRQGGAGGDLSGADGVEWMNADSEWRDESPSALLNALLHLPVRPAESFTTLLDRPAASLRRWDALTRRRPVIGLSAVDAHGLVGGLYTTTFRSFAQAVILDAPLSGNASTDAARIVKALRGGRAFSVVTGLAAAALPVLIARDETRSVSMGEHLTSSSGRVSVEASMPAAAGARVVIMHNDRSIAEGFGHAEVAGPAEPGAYRAEFWLGRGRIPWIVTNPLYIDPPIAPIPVPTAASRQPAVPTASDASVAPLGFGPEWTIEHAPSSSGTVTATTLGLEFKWTLGQQQPGLEFAALARSVGDGTESFDRVEFTASATQPLRLSVQFRLPGGHDGERWGRSVYLDATPRTVTVRMADVSPLGFSATRRPIVARIKSLLFVMDTLHTAPGSTGVVQFSNVRLLRSEDPTASGPDGQEQVGRPGQEQQVRRPGREGGRQ